MRSPRPVLITCLLLLIHMRTMAQESDSGFIEQKRKIIDTVEEPIAKWPYFGSNIPPYLALTGGIETFNAHYFFGGLAYNMLLGTVYPNGAMFAGLRTYYKQNMNNKNNYAFETDLCIMSSIALGLNYNYTHVPGHYVNGFKPFIGLSFFNVQVYYGYCFYKNSLDPEKRLVHNRFTLNFNLPVAKLSRRKTVTRYVYEKDPWDQDE